MPHITANNINIAYDLFATLSASKKRPLILIRGLGSQRVEWPQVFIDYFARTRDVVIFDNRDVGQSARFDVAGVPDLQALGKSLKAGESFAVPYGMADMAADVIGLMDALDIEKADILGMSLGGIIVQHLACDYAGRLGGAVCVMSLSGNRALPAPAISHLMAPDVDDEAALIDYLVQSYAEDEGSAFPCTPAQRRARAQAAVANGYSPQGMLRQLAASAVDGDRRPRLQKIAMPFLVIHGRDDKLIDPVCGEDIAANVRHAQLMLVDGMGHDIAPNIENVLGPRVVDFLDAID